jgi:anti-sigma regulatory factor (Ser/Thr protein kinase)
MDVSAGNVKESLKNIISSTNDYVATIHTSSNMFATVFFGILDPESGILSYANGGHVPPAILDKSGKIVRRLDPTGPAVGLFPGVNYQVEQVELDKGDFLVGFTDGVTDATDKSEQLFTEERLLRYIQVPWTSLFSMLFELKSELKDHMGGEKQFDDITMISIRRKLSMNLEKHALCRPANLNALEDMHYFVEAAAQECKLPNEAVLAFQQATQEVCKDIIQHGFKGRRPGVISLFFENDPIKTRLTIRDDGNFLATDRGDAPDLEAGWMAGLGRDSFDRVAYSRMDAQGNQLILEKKRQPQEHWLDRETENSNPARN